MNIAGYFKFTPNNNQILTNDTSAKDLLGKKNNINQISANEPPVLNQNDLYPQDETGFDYSTNHNFFNIDQQNFASDHLTGNILNTDYESVQKLKMLNKHLRVKSEQADIVKKNFHTSSSKRSSIGFYNPNLTNNRKHLSLDKNSNHQSDKNEFKSNNSSSQHILENDNNVFLKRNSPNNSKDSSVIKQNKNGKKAKLFFTKKNSIESNSKQSAEIQTSKGKISKQLDSINNTKKIYIIPKKDLLTRRSSQKSKEKFSNKNSLQTFEDKNNSFEKTNQKNDSFCKKTGNGKNFQNNVPTQQFQELKSDTSTEKKTKNTDSNERFINSKNNELKVYFPIKNFHKRLTADEAFYKSNELGEIQPSYENLTFPANDIDTKIKPNDNQLSISFFKDELANKTPIFSNIIISKYSKINQNESKSSDKILQFEKTKINSNQNIHDLELNSEISVFDYPDEQVLSQKNINSDLSILLPIKSRSEVMIKNALKNVEIFNMKLQKNDNKLEISDKFLMNSPKKNSLNEKFESSSDCSITKNRKLGFLKDSQKNKLSYEIKLNSVQIDNNFSNKTKTSKFVSDDIVKILDTNVISKLPTIVSDLKESEVLETITRNSGKKIKQSQNLNNENQDCLHIPLSLNEKSSIVSHQELITNKISKANDLSKKEFNVKSPVCKQNDTSDDPSKVWIAPYKKSPENLLNQSQKLLTDENQTTKVENFNKKTPKNFEAKLDKINTDMISYKKKYTIIKDLLPKKSILKKKNLEAKKSPTKKVKQKKLKFD